MFNRKVLIFSLVFAVFVSVVFWIDVSSGQSTREWVEIQTQDSPSGRLWFAMDYDPIRDRVVLFGGSVGGGNIPHSDETWEYDGSNWEKIETANSPPELRHPYMVYFPPMNGMILFGGQSLLGISPEDTWFYDGVDWTILNLDPLQSPPPRSNHSMAYDEQREVIVLFSGDSHPTQGPRIDNDTWEFDGNSWTQIYPPVSPTSITGPRKNADMTYDKSRGKIVLYGGGDDLNHFNDTWEYDGQTWVKINTLTSPDIARNWPSVTYDDSDEVVVLFGGVSRLSGTTQFSQDTWVYDGVSWSKLSTANHPEARGGAKLVYRSAADVVTLFGGYISTTPEVLNDTWEMALVNQSPLVDAGGPYSGNEGNPISLAGSASDPDDNPMTYSWSVDSTKCTFSDIAILNPDITCNDDGTFAATLTVSDGVNDPVNSDTSIIVYNVAPSIDNILAPTAPVNINDQSITISVEFSDPGTADTHDVTWDWGDTLSDVQEEVQSPATKQHTYAETGVYPVTVTVTDDDGGSDTDIYEFIVVYDPEGGFVTGGGWIYSPAGWCKLNDVCAGAEGKANFGFVSKYKKGTNVPTGNTEFNFKAGGLIFQSTDYNWLVVNQNGTNAQYKGSGTINGEGAYKFMLWAKDLNPNEDDTLRIKIWYEDGEENVVYDNSFEQTIGAGNIVVHAGKKK